MRFDEKLLAVERAMSELASAYSDDLEERAGNEVLELESSKWTVDFMGSKEGVRVSVGCGELTDYIAVGLLSEVFDWDIAHIAEGDVGYGQQLLTDLERLTERVRVALTEGKQHPFQ